MKLCVEKEHALGAFRVRLWAEPLWSYLRSEANKTFLIQINQYDGWRQLVWTKWSELCFKKPASCLYRESWKREFVQWNDCKVFLATWVRCCLFLSHPLLPHHPSNGSLFRAPSNTVTTVTVHKQVGGAKRFGNGKCERASHSASISSLSSSLFGTFATLKLTWHFFLNCGWVDAVYWHTFLRVGVRVHSLNVFLKLRVRAVLTEIWIRLHIYLKLLETHLLLYFILLWKTMHPYFNLPC